MRIHRRCFVLLALLLPLAGRVDAENQPDPPAANPARPTVSTPATLTPPGYLQFENGGLFATHSPEFEHRFGLNQVTKLSVNEWIQFIAVLEPFTHSTGAAVSGNRPGEVFARVQAVVMPGSGKRPTLSGQYQRRLYASPAPELDLGTFVQSASILLSDDFSGFHFDLNGLVMEQQDDFSRVRRAQFAQTLSISHSIRKMIVSVELWHFAQPLVHSNAVGNLWSLSYAVKPNLILDTGCDRGLTSTSTHWEYFAGFTYLLPHRLWQARSELRQPAASH